MCVGVCAASSTTGDTQQAAAPRCWEPNQWSIEDVVQHISHTDSGLGAYVDLFRRHVSCCHSLAVGWMDALRVRDVAAFAEHHTRFITRRCHASVLPNTGRQNSGTKQPVQKEMRICSSFFTVVLLFKVLFCSFEKGA